MDVFFIRHGETDFNKNQLIQGRGIDMPLNQKGRQQAKAVARLLKPYRIDKIIGSSLIRSQETAKLIRNGKTTFEFYKEIDEMDFGEIEGLPFHQIKEKISTIHSKWTEGYVEFKCPGGGESPREVFERANKKILEILTKSSEESIAFVIHGRLIRILLSEWLGHGLANMHTIQHSNGGVNHLSWDGQKFKAVSLNQVAHLDDLAGR